MGESQGEAGWRGIALIGRLPAFAFHERPIILLPTTHALRYHELLHEVRADSQGDTNVKQRAVARRNVTPSSTNMREDTVLFAAMTVLDEMLKADLSHATSIEIGDAFCRAVIAHVDESVACSQQVLDIRYATGMTAKILRRDLKKKAAQIRQSAINTGKYGAMHLAGAYALGHVPHMLPTGAARYAGAVAEAHINEMASQTMSVVARMVPWVGTARGAWLMKDSISLAFQSRQILSEAAEVGRISTALRQPAEMV